MAWPSGTKASTQNVDQGGDKISLARADIKQNIDNVNDMIDHLNISSPSDGDILRYSSSSGKWEQVASTTITPYPIALLSLKLGVTIDVPTFYGVFYPELEIVSDPGGFVTLGTEGDYDSAGPEPVYRIDSAGEIPAFSLATGYYRFSFIGSWPIAEAQQTYVYTINSSENSNLAGASGILSISDGQSGQNYTPKHSFTNRRYHFLSINPSTFQFNLTPTLANHGRIMIEKLA